MDFLFMLTRHDRTVEDADDAIEAACDLGATHIGFEDVGVIRGDAWTALR